MSEKPFDLAKFIRERAAYAPKPVWARPGRKPPRAWQYSIWTAKPNMVYNYYMDVELECSESMVSPKTTPDPYRDNVHRVTFTQYLGGYLASDFNARGHLIVAQKVAEIRREFPRCVVVRVVGVYRHKQGNLP